MFLTDNEKKKSGKFIEIILIELPLKLLQKKEEESEFFYCHVVDRPQTTTAIEFAYSLAHGYKLAYRRDMKIVGKGQVRTFFSSGR